LASENSIEVVELTKRFKETLAVDRVSFSVARGEFFGFLGPNGAGKTTTIKMLCGLMKPTSGCIAVAGRDVVADPLGVKARIGILPDTIETFDRLTGWELVVFSGLMYGLPEDEVRRRAGVLLDLADLDPVDREKLVIDYSMGMRKKAALACALVHGPEVLFLDEPFNGIDATSTNSIQKVLQNLAAKGVTIFYTSHVLEVVEKLCTRLAVIDRGRIRAMGTVKDLREAAGMPPDASLNDVYDKLIGREAKGGDLDWVVGQPRGAAPPPPPSEPAKAIGVATMAPDGTITIHLNPEHAREGNGLVTVAAGDPRHAELVKHLGGLAPGEVKAVAGWTP
jgi:ABC-2 type transport system ATP-binding protein